MQQTRNILNLLIWKSADQTIAITKVSTAFTVVHFDYWICTLSYSWEVGRMSDGTVFRNTWYIQYDLSYKNINICRSRRYFPFSQYCMKPYNRKNWLTWKFVLVTVCVTEYMIGIWINRFRIFANMANLTQDQALVVVIVTLALQNLLRFKSRDSYTPKGPVD